MNQPPYSNPYGNPYSPPAPPGGGYGGGPPGYGGPPAGYGGGDYEFTAEENSVISSAALWARLLGIFLIITGAVSLLNCNVITFAIDLAIGIFFLGGASALSAVVNTQGNDIQHMMTALSKLGTAFKIRVIVTIVAVVLLLVIGLGIGALAIASAAR